jgi:hypothetical protein
MIIKTHTQGNVFRRKHDGMLFGNEIVLGLDFSTGSPREDLPEYYEEIRDPELPAMPNLTGKKITIPEAWEVLFPNDRFIVGGFDIPLERTTENVLCVDVAYLGWQAFRAELLKPEHAALANHMGAVMRYLEEQHNKQNYV